MIKKIYLFLFAVSLFFLLTGESCETDIPMLKVYPNPAHDILNVEMSDEMLAILKSEGEPIPRFSRIEIYSLQTGEKIKTINYPSNPIDVSFLKTGAYMLMVFEDALIGEAKFLKQ